MSVHDSARIVEVLQPEYEPCASADQADLVVVNTCSVRAKSQQKVLSTLGRYSRQKRVRPDMVLVVAGCVAQQEGAKLLDAVSGLDVVVGPDHIASIPALVEQARRSRQVEVGFTDAEDYRFLRARPTGGGGPTALVTIQKGCDNSCAYCIVPSVRGPCISRPQDQVLEEVSRLVESGVKEVTLIGQNVNAFRGGRGASDDFVRLLEHVDRVPGLLRLRFTTSHPKDFHPRLAACFGGLRRLCPWLHLAVQSGSSRVLEAMNRGYDREHYLGCVRAVRDACPEVTIGTDLIVGFPGETERDFLDTVSLVEEIQFDYSYSFKYSPRPGTPAARLEDTVEEGEKARRLGHLQATQDRITRSSLQRLVGQSVHVLVEGPSRKGLPQLCGRTPGNQVVNIDGAGGRAAAGEVVEARVMRAGGHSVSAVLAASPRTRETREVQCSSR